MTTWTTYAAVKATIVDRLRTSDLLAGCTLDGVPWRDEDVLGPQGDGVVVWLDGAADVAVEQRALGVGKIGETWDMAVNVQCLPSDSSTGVRDAESRCADLVSAVKAELLYEGSQVLAVDLDGWTVRASSTGDSWESGPMESARGGYAVLCRVGLTVTADRC